MKLYKYIAVALLTISVSSCNLYKKYELPVNNSFVKDYDNALKAEVDSASLPYLSWEEVFTDTLLQKYIRIALADNKDLDDARQNVKIAMAQLKGAKLSYFPSVAFSPNGGSAAYGNAKLNNWSYTLPLSVQWEIDVFGKILNRKRGAKVTVEQMEDYRQAVQSQIICGVANCYYSLVLLNQQLDLTQRTAEIWKDQVESMRLMKQAGMVNEAAVVQSAANYWSIMGSIPDIKQGIKEASNSLSILLHKYPQEWEVSQNLDFNLPVGLENGVPVTYLGARPDVRAAERGLAAAYYNTTSARAAFYPGLTISAQGGFTNMLGSMISNPGSWFLQLAGSLVAPIFSRGQNIANLQVAKAKQVQAMNAFENTILSASADVSDALSKYQTNQEKRKCLLQQIDNLEKSVEYTQELLTLDRNTTYLEVLTARSSLLSAQLSSLAAWHNKVVALITLYQTVGGGR